MSKETIPSSQLPLHKRGAVGVDDLPSHPCTILSTQNATTFAISSGSPRRLNELFFMTPSRTASLFPRRKTVQSP